MEISCFRGKDQAAKDIEGRYPITHHWDAHDPKLVVCEARILPKTDHKEEKKKATLTKQIEEGPVSTVFILGIYLVLTFL